MAARRMIAEHLRFIWPTSFFNAYEDAFHLAERDDAVGNARNRYPSIGFPFLRRQGENPDIVGRKHSKDWNNIAAFPSAPASHKVGAKLPMSSALARKSASLIGA